MFDLFVNMNFYHHLPQFTKQSAKEYPKIGIYKVAEYKN